MMNGVLIVFSGAWLLSVPQSSSGDEQAIRKAYRIRDRAYAKRDVKALAGTELPDFFAISYDKKIITHDQVKDHLAWRFKSQVACFRTEKPVSISISGETATVQVKISDEYFLQNKGGPKMREFRREYGTARWQKMPEGWRLESIRFTKVEWVDKKGKWQVAPKPAKK